MAKFAHVIRLTGPFHRDLPLWSQLADANVLRRLELHTPIPVSRDLHVYYLPDPCCASRHSAHSYAPAAGTRSR